MVATKTFQLPFFRKSIGNGFYCATTEVPKNLECFSGFFVLSNVITWNMELVATSYHQPTQLQILQFSQKSTLSFPFFYISVCQITNLQNFCYGHLKVLLHI